MPRGQYTRKLSPIGDRFWPKVNKDGPVPPHRPELGPCWVWAANKGPFGHGTLSVGGRSGRPQLAHRVAWFLATGQWPELCVLHKCDTASCVRLDHLFLGTHQDNVADMVAKGRQRSRATRGEAQHASVFTERDVLQMREWHASGVSCREIAARVGKKLRTVKAAVSGQNWKWLKCG